MSEQKPSKDLLAAVEKGAKLNKTGASSGDQSMTQAKLQLELKKGAELKKVSTNEGAAMNQAKLQLEVKKGAELKKVEAPSAEVSDAVKKAFVEDQKEKK